MRKDSQKPVVLMIYTKITTFTKRDIEILSSHYIVDDFGFNKWHKIFTPIQFLRQFLFMALRFNRYSFYITQSSGYISVLPVLFGKLNKTKTVIIAIGTDCANLPEIAYGTFNKMLLGLAAKFSYKRANVILPVHKSLAFQHYNYIDAKYPEQGFKAFIPNLKTNVKEVVNGYNSAKWRITSTQERGINFLTVTIANNMVGAKRKGLDLILFLAKHYTEHTFTIVGDVDMTIFKEEVPKNIVLHKTIPQQKLLEIYNQHRFYLQLSMFEGFPNALCEAMLCGCIPIGSAVAGIPDIIGESGYILKFKNHGDLIALIDKAISDDYLTPTLVRKRIEDNFPLERRKKELLQELTLLS